MNNNFSDKDFYMPQNIEKFSELHRKYLSVLKKVDEETKKLKKDEYVLLVANSIRSEKDQQFLLAEAIKIIREQNINIVQRFNVHEDEVKQANERLLLKEGDDMGSKGDTKEEFDRLLSYALANNVSDIHIKALKSGCIIQLKIDGELENYKTLSYEFAKTMISALYNSDSKEIEGASFSTKESQQSVIQKQIDGIDIQLRYQSSPIFGGEDGFKVVMRILNLGRMEESDDRTKYLKLDQLGYAPSHIENIEGGVAKPVGATIIAGVTGSGKSTTLKHLLMFMNHQTDFKKVFYTLEDPPEFLIPGVTQIGVSRNKKGTGFVPYEKELAVMMRFDPDVIMIGEIRDEVTAKGLTKATESGHKVLSTTHASSALEIIKRLYGFKVGSNDMASPSFLSCLIYQKLMPVLCDHCKIKLVHKLEDANVSNELIKLKERLEEVCDLNKDQIYIRNEEGCPHCNHKGAKGRTVCAETINPDLTLLVFFRDNKMIEAKEYWRSLSDKDRDSDNFVGKTVLEHAIYKMRQGKISPLDIEIELGPINAAYREMLEIEKRAKKSNEDLFNKFYINKNLMENISKNNDDDDFKL